MKQATRRHRSGFTLIEMLIVLAIIAILASLTYGAYWRAQGTAREAKTKATIAKLHGLIMARWEAVRNRRLPITNQAAYDNWVSNNGAMPAGMPNGTTDPPRPPTNTHLWKRQQLGRLHAQREIMRMEFPERFADIVNIPASWTVLRSSLLVNASVQQTSLQRAYARKIQAAITQGFTPTCEFESAECLYLIVTTSAGDESLTGGEFSNIDVADTDRDGMKEFLDGWGRPIGFYRWAPGHISDLQPNPTTGGSSPYFWDPHDPLDHAGLDYSTSNTNIRGFALTPLIVSAGPDGIPDLWFDISTTPNNQRPVSLDPYRPYTAPGGTYRVGQPVDMANDGSLDSFDNITNHNLNLRQ